jgi:hypothetical protein
MINADIEKLSYGSKIKCLEADKPTGFGLKDDITIVSLETELIFEEGMLMELRWATSVFDTAKLRASLLQDYHKKLRESLSSSTGRHSRDDRPKGEISKKSIAWAGQAINDIFELPCRDHQDMPIHHNNKESHDHTQHKVRKPRKNIVLLLSDKKKCLHDLEFLQCDPHKQ